MSRAARVMCSDNAERANQWLRRCRRARVATPSRPPTTSPNGVGFAGRVLTVGGRTSRATSIVPAMRFVACLSVPCPSFWPDEVPRTLLCFVSLSSNACPRSARCEISPALMWRPGVLRDRSQRPYRRTLVASLGFRARHLLSQPPCLVHRARRCPIIRTHPVRPAA